MRKFIDSNGLTERELFVRLGEGSISRELVLGVLGETKGKKRERRRKKQRITGRPLVRVDGVEGLDVRMARCCNPIPGDRIVAVIGRKGITIHRVGCRNLRGIPAERLFHAEWIDGVVGEFSARMSVELEGKGLLGKVMDTLEAMNVRVEKVEVRDTSWGTVRVIIDLKVSGVGQMDEVLREMRAIEKVIEVERVMG